MRDCISGMVDWEEVDALWARHVHRNAPPAQVTVPSILRTSVSSLHIPSGGSNGPFPGTWTPAPAANVPLRVCGRRRQLPATPRPWSRPGSFPNCPAAPIPPAVCGNCWSGWLAPRDPKSLMSPATCESRTARVAARSSRAPGARRPLKAAAPLSAQPGWVTSQKPSFLTIDPPDEANHYGRPTTLPRGHPAAH